MLWIAASTGSGVVLSLVTVTCARPPEPADVISTWIGVTDMAAAGGCGKDRAQGGREQK